MERRGAVRFVSPPLSQVPRAEFPLQGRRTCHVDTWPSTSPVHSQSTCDDEMIQTRQPEHGLSLSLSVAHSFFLSHKYSRRRNVGAILYLESRGLPCVTWDIIKMYHCSPPPPSLARACIAERTSRRTKEGGNRFPSRDAAIIIPWLWCGAFATYRGAYIVRRSDVMLLR